MIERCITVDVVDAAVGGVVVGLPFPRREEVVTDISVGEGEACTSGSGGKVRQERKKNGTGPGVRCRTHCRMGVGAGRGLGGRWRGGGGGGRGGRKRTSWMRRAQAAPPSISTVSAREVKGVLERPTLVLYGRRCSFRRTSYEMSCTRRNVDTI